MHRPMLISRKCEKIFLNQYEPKMKITSVCVEASIILVDEISVVLPNHNPGRIYALLGGIISDHEP